ncbi:MAG: YceI family protein [Phycisphaerales bacterium]|nr:YceI family protein [Phycisphaerales bacterium]
MIRKTTVFAASLFVLGLGSAALLAGAGSAPSAPAVATAARADSYKIDAVHSAVLFRINHVGAGVFWGRFNKIDGDFFIDPAKPETSYFKVTIPIASVDTANEKRDEHLRSGDFFNARQYPTASFQSTSITGTSEENVFELKGDLTLMGETRPITARLLFGGNGTMQGKAIQGFEADFTIKRADFGISTYLAPDGGNGGALGNDVRIIVAGEGVKQ